MEKNRKLIYIAGALNNDAVHYIQNLHRMIKWENEIRQLGFSTFCPGFDFLGGLVNGNWDYKDYFENNQLILERCDAIFLVPGYESSQGTQKEIAKAKRLDIPIFLDRLNMANYFKGDRHK